MDQDPAAPIKASAAPAVRTALNVLALCFALSVLGRGLVESFTVFLLPISESFGWYRGPCGSGCRPAVRPFWPAHRLFGGPSPAWQRFPGRGLRTTTVAVSTESWAGCRHRRRADRQRPELDPARPLVWPAAADRDGRGVFRDRCRRAGVAAAVTDLY